VFPWLETSPISGDIDIREYKKKMQVGIQLFDKLFNSDLQNISLHVLEQTLSELSEMEKANFLMPEGFTENFKTGMLKYGEWLDKNGKLSEEQKMQMKSDLNNAELMEDTATLLFKGMEHSIQQAIAYFTIIVCSVITTQHVSSTRYPENGKDPLESYTLKNPVVKLQLKYLALLENAARYLLCFTHVSPK